jgi:hypothetical protein
VKKAYLGTRKISLRDRKISRGLKKTLHAGKEISLPGKKTSYHVH